MKDHLYIFLALGGVAIVTAWLPYISSKIRLSDPIFLLLFGALLFSLGVPMIWPNPIWPNEWILYISEAIVIVSLMSAGLKIGKNYTKKDWKIVLRLIIISMPLFLVGIFLFGYYFLGLSLALSVLLAAVLAPTDPVLASEVQIDNISEKRSITSKFALTGEAGINDGLAFPFTILAISIFSAGAINTSVMIPWFFDTFLLRISLGIALGYIFGKVFGYALDKVPKLDGIGKPMGFIAIAITFFVYSTTELLHGYGFLAVFVCAVVMRHSEEVAGSIKQKMHDFTDETEKLLLILWIILFGGSILNGVFNILRIEDIIFSILLICILRPLTAYIGLAQSNLCPRERFVISFFGIRGIGSIFYLSWAFVQNPNFLMQDRMYAIVSFIIFISIIIHGITAPYFIGKVEKSTS